MNKSWSRERRLSGMLFNNETVTRNDFRRGEIPPQVVTEYFDKPRRSKVAEYRPPNNIQSMGPVKYQVPFDLFIKYDPIVRHDPREMQKPYEKMTDLERAKSQKNRRQCVMTPAVSFDSMTNDEAYALIVNDMYKSTVHKDTAETAEMAFKRNPCKAPFPGTYAHCKPNRQ